MRIKTIFSVAAIACIMYSCSKSTPDQCVTYYGHPSESEMTSVQSFINSKGITATKDSARGIFYNIPFAGTGTESPVLTDSVTVKYKGSLADGTVFDSTATGETRTFPLNRLITGWQVGLPLLKKNGVIDLYLPPSHGYGCQGQYPIPGNAITIFHIELVNF